MSTRRTILAVLGVLCLGLTASPAAQAVIKNPEIGSFGHGHFSAPIGVAVNQATHDIYVAGLSGGVDEFGASHKLLAPSPFGSGGSLYSGVAINPTNGAVDVINAASQTVETYDPSSGAFVSSFSISGSANFFGAYTLVQLATDIVGNVYVPNAPNNEVQVFGSTGGAPNGVTATIAGSGVNALSSPTGVAVDSSGDVWVADKGNNRVEEFDPSGTFVKQIASPGVQALAIDKAGDIYAAGNDGSGFRVAVYLPSGNQLTEFGLHTIGSSELGIVNTLAIDQETGLVYVTDGLNSVVWVYGPPTVLPDVSTGAQAAGVTATTATIGGTVNADETSVINCRFEYGKDTSYPATTPCSTSVPFAGNAQLSQSASLVGLQPGTTYHYRLVASNEKGTNEGEDGIFTTPPSAPSLDAVSASAVTQTSATINANINPNNQDTTYHFDFGPGSGYGTTLPVSDADIGSGYGDVAVGQQLSGLTPGTIYHFRAVATNASGATTSTDVTFTTPPLKPPIVSATEAGEVTPSAATLSGSVDPQGSQTTYEIDLGTDTDYGSRIFGDAGDGAGPRALAVRVNGLASATSYHYRIVATNVFGTTYGPDRTFATPPVPSSLLASPPTAALVPTPQTGTSPVKAKIVKPTTPRKKKASKKKKKHKKKPARKGGQAGTSSKRRGK
jgi:hypothetical protein